MNNASKPILDVKNLSITIKKSFLGRKARTLIKEANFHVNKNEIVIIQGPNASGKSSLLNAITGQSPKQLHIEGEIIYNQVSMNNSVYSSMYSTISYTNQNPTFKSYNVKDYINTNLDNYKYKRNVNDTKKEEMFNKFDKKNLWIENKLSKRSGGEKRILSLISAFLREKADLFILDEPLNDLDFETALKVNNHLQELKKTSAVLIISHCRMNLDVDRAYQIYKRDDGGSMAEVVKPSRCSSFEQQSCHSK